MLLFSLTNVTILSSLKDSAIHYFCVNLVVQMIDKQITYSCMTVSAYLSDFVAYITKHLPLIIRNRLESNSNYNLSGNIALKTKVVHTLTYMYKCFVDQS